MAKIIVVDDDRHIRELVKLLLKNEGSDVFEATDGTESLYLLESTQVKLMVLDSMVPNMDGWALCQEIRTIYEFPILMLTAKRDTEDKLKGFNLVTDD